MPKNNLPKQFSEWSFEQGDRKWQQDELEHGLELWENFFLEEYEVSGCWNKWRGSMRHGARPRGWARPGPLWPDGGSPWCVLSARYSQILQKKSYFNFRAFGELLFSGYFYIAWIIRKQK